MKLELIQTKNENYLVTDGVNVFYTDAHVKKVLRVTDMEEWEWAVEEWGKTPFEMEVSRNHGKLLRGQLLNASINLRPEGEFIEAYLIKKVQEFAQNLKHSQDFQFAITNLQFVKSPTLFFKVYDLRVCLYMNEDSTLQGALWHTDENSVVKIEGDIAGALFRTKSTTKYKMAISHGNLIAMAKTAAAMHLLDYWKVYTAPIGHGNA